VHVGIVQPAPERVLLAARARTEEAAAEGIARMRFATGVDDDLRPFHEAYRDDPVLGRALRANPALRVRRAPLPWESLAAAITEQLIEFERAVAIQRRLIAALGRRCPRTGLRDAPEPGTIAAAAPARLAAFDLSPSRALTLRRAAAEVAAGRVDLLAGDPMPGWRRLRAIPGIGPWTLEVLALYGQGHHDRVPAGDLGYLKLVGRVRTGNPRARAEEATLVHPTSDRDAAVSADMPIPDRGNGDRSLCRCRTPGRSRTLYVRGCKVHGEPAATAPRFAPWHPRSNQWPEPSLPRRPLRRATRRVRCTSA